MPRKYTQVTLNCAYCSKEFHVIRAIAETRLFCSRDCLHSAHRLHRICAQCGTDFLTTLSKPDRKFCSEECYRKFQNVPDAVRFARYLNPILNAFGCQFYTGALGSGGYGQFSVNGRSMPAHRFAYQLANGPIPDKESVQHLCAGFYPKGDITNRRCVNPAHLTTGSAFKNAQQTVADDRIAKGDRAGARLHPEKLERGENHHGAILTDADVLSMRARSTGRAGEIRDFTAEYGMEKGYIGKILRRKVWTHI